MLGPLGEALKMESIHALGLAGSCSVPFDDLSLADGTNIFGFVLCVIVFLFLLTDHSRQPLAG